MMKIDFNLINILISFAGFLLALAIYSLTKQQVKDAWLKASSEIHLSFWNDAAIAEMRCCLAYEKAYKPLKVVLEKRKAIENNKDEEPLDEDEYLLLDKLDKFFNLLERAMSIRPYFKPYHDIWRELFFRYWLDVAMKPNRPEMIWYIDKFYPELSEVHEEFQRIDQGKCQIIEYDEHEHR